MKALSLKQPFAELLATGKKTIELRFWNTHFRGRFLIHASGNIDFDSCSELKIDPKGLARGAIIGGAVLFDVKMYPGAKEFYKDSSKHLATSKYFNKDKKQYGFIIKDPVKFAKPIAMPGKLGFFYVDMKI